MDSKVSIIIPIYNTEKYLKTCLDSILGQTYENLEIILVDDGSADNSGKIIDDYAKKDRRIKAIHQKNQGQSAARNNGLKEATGDYIGFIDSDDKIDPTFVEKLLAPYQNKNTALTVCGIHYNRLKTATEEDAYISELRPKTPRESKEAYILRLLALDGRLYSSVNKLYRASIAKTLSFDVSLKFGEDTRFVLNYLKKTANKIEFILEPLYVYNFGTETSTVKKTSTSWENWQNLYLFLKSWLGSKPNLNEKFWLHMVHLRWRISFVRSRRRAK